MRLKEARGRNQNQQYSSMNHINFKDFKRPAISFSNLHLGEEPSNSAKSKIAR